MTSSIKIMVLWFGLSLALVPSPVWAQTAPSLSVRGDGSAGHATLTWTALEGDSAAEYMLQESTSADFSEAYTRYQGPHRSSVVSGLLDGTYYFRVRSRQGERHPWSSWSATEHFKVEHHPLPLALTLLGLGALVFGLTLAFLFTSAREDSA